MIEPGLELNHPADLEESQIQKSFIVTDFTGNVCTGYATQLCRSPSSICGSLPIYSSIHSGGYDLTCEDQHCRCPWNEYYDYCTCLPHVGSCLIERDSEFSIGIPSSFGGGLERKYSCVAFDNCEYEVHVIGNYESSNGIHGSRVTRLAGDTDVVVSVTGESSRPLILVLTSYEPVRWRLSVTSGVTIDRVILSSVYNSTINYQPAGAIQYTEVLTHPINFTGYGADTGGRQLAQLLLYLQQRFGPVSSFSGSYRADRWVLNINRTAGNTSCFWNNTLCAELPPPANGRVDIVSLEPETRVRYSCDVGFLLSRSRFRSCLQSGVWSGEAPNCTEPVETCPLPSPPLNGYVSLDNSTRFSESRYTCNSGYKVVGTANRICLRDRGVWSGNDVICKRLRCSSLFSPLFGYVDFNGTQAVFSCRSGYLLVGSRVLVCRVTEEWSGEAPTCVKNRTFCPLLSAPEDGQVSVRSRTFGSTATYSCDTGKTLVGERTRTCLSDGTWSRRKPICSERCFGTRCSDGSCVSRYSECDSQLSTSRPTKAYESETTYHTEAGDSNSPSTGKSVGIGVGVTVLVVVGVVLTVLRVVLKMFRGPSYQPQRSTVPVQSSANSSCPPLSSSEAGLVKESTFSAVSDQPPAYSEAVSLPSSTHYPQPPAS